MDNDNIEEMMNRIVADTIREILTNNPTSIAEKKSKYTEKPMAWIELHEDILDEAYDMSKEYREYE